MPNMVLLHLVMYTEKGQVYACTQPIENKPSSPPTPMLVGVMTESLDSTVVLVDPHTSSLSEIQLDCVRGAGQLTEVFLMSM